MKPGISILIAAALMLGATQAAAQEDRSRASSKGGIFVNPLGLVLGFASAELAFAPTDSLSINFMGGYQGASSGDLELDVYVGSLGVQVFMDSERAFDGAFIYPQMVFGNATVSDSDGDDASATVYGGLALVGYQWDWQPFSLRLGAGIGYVVASA